MMIIKNLMKIIMNQILNILSYTKGYNSFFSRNVLNIKLSHFIYFVSLVRQQMKFAGIIYCKSFLYDIFVFKMLYCVYIRMKLIQSNLRNIRVRRVLGLTLFQLGLTLLY